MPEELNDPLLVTFIGGTLLLSLATGFYLLAPCKRTAAGMAREVGRSTTGLAW